MPPLSPATPVAWQVVFALLFALLASGGVFHQLMKTRGDVAIKRIDSSERYIEQLRTDIATLKAESKEALKESEARYDASLAQLKATTEKQAEQIEKLKEERDEERRLRAEEKAASAQRHIDELRSREDFEERILSLIEYRFGDRPSWDEVVRDIKSAQKERRGGFRAKPEPARPVAPLPRRRLLVVDDTPDTADMMATAFRLDGMTVHKSTNAPDALQQIAMSREVNKPFDFALLDYSMPGMNGEELFLRIREMEEENGLPPMPIAFLTGNEDFISQAVKDRTDVECWEKPMLPEKVREKVQAMLEG